MELGGVGLDWTFLAPIITICSVSFTLRRYNWIPTVTGLPARRNRRVRSDRDGRFSWMATAAAAS